MWMTYYLVSYVDLVKGKFHQEEVNSHWLGILQLIERNEGRIQLLDSQYIAKGSLT